MFQNLQPPPETASGHASRWSLQLLRDRRVHLALVAAGLCVLAGGAALYAAWQSALSDDCALEQIDLSVEELISLRQRLRGYQAAGSADSAITLSGDELSFFVWNKLDYKARIHLDDDHVTAKVVLPVKQETCFNVDFRGRLRVEDGVAMVWPEHLVVGSLALSRWVPRRVDIRPPQLKPAAGEALANTRWLEVREGEARVELRDRMDAW